MSTTSTAKKGAIMDSAEALDVAVMSVFVQPLSGLAQAFFRSPGVALRAIDIIALRADPPTGVFVSFMGA